MIDGNECFTQARVLICLRTVYSIRTSSSLYKYYWQCACVFMRCWYPSPVTSLLACMHFITKGMFGSWCVMRHEWFYVVSFVFASGETVTYCLYYIKLYMQNHWTERKVCATQIWPVSTLMFGGRDHIVSYLCCVNRWHTGSWGAGVRLCRQLNLLLPCPWLLQCHTYRKPAWAL